MAGHSTLEHQPPQGQHPQSSSYQVVADLLAKADVQINGERPWDMHFHRPGVPEQILSRGNLGLGETYMAGDWDCERLDERFCRMWRYYLLSCAGAFRARDIQLWQLVLSKSGLVGGYQRPE